MRAAVTFHLLLFTYHFLKQWYNTFISKMLKKPDERGVSIEFRQK